MSPWQTARRTVGTPEALCTAPSSYIPRILYIENACDFRSPSFYLSFHFICRFCQWVSEWVQCHTVTNAKPSPNYVCRNIYSYVNVESRGQPTGVRFNTPSGPRTFHSLAQDSSFFSFPASLFGSFLCVCMCSVCMCTYFFFFFLLFFSLVRYAMPACRLLF